MILGFAISSSAKISCGGRKTTKQKKLPSRKLAYPTKQESRKNHPASKVWADWDIGYVILPSRVTSIDPKTRSSESPASPSSPQFPPPKKPRGNSATWQGGVNSTIATRTTISILLVLHTVFRSKTKLEHVVHNFSGKTSGKSLGPHF